MVESVLITFSILFALAVDSWAEQRNDRELAAQSLAIFEREIRQNLARVEDVAPYHRGLSAVVGEMVQDPARAAELRNGWREHRRSKKAVSTPRAQLPDDDVVEIGQEIGPAQFS